MRCSELPDLEVVGEVGDGPTLSPALERLQPDLLVIDVTMPHFEPIAAIREIRARYPALKILVVSAYDDDAYVQGLLGVGVDGYHLKDQPLSDLRLAVQRVLAGERWISSNLIGKLLSYAEFSSPRLRLTDRQREILALLSQGHDNQSLARETGLSVKTIENHLTRIYRQLNVQSRLEAVRYVTEHPEVLGTRQLVRSASQICCRGAALATLLVDDNAALPQPVATHARPGLPAGRDLRGRQHRAKRCGCCREVHAPARAGRRDPRRRRRHPMRPAHQGVVARSRGSILITAYPDREFRRLGIEAGASALLDKKDLDAASLRLMIDDVLA